MALLAPQPVAAALNPVALNATNAGGDTVARADNGFVLFRNPTGGAITVTIDTPGTTHGLAIADASVVIGAGNFAIVPINDEVFVHPDDHLIHLAYSAGGLTAAVCHL